MVQLRSRARIRMRTWARILVTFLLLSATGWVFRDVPHHAFVNWDDGAIFPDSLPYHGLSVDGLRWVGAFTGGEWQPLARLILLVQMEIFGDNPFGVQVGGLRPADEGWSSAHRFLADTSGLLRFSGAREPCSKAGWEPAALDVGQTAADRKS